MGHNRTQRQKHQKQKIAIRRGIEGSERAKIRDALQRIILENDVRSIEEGSRTITLGENHDHEEED